MTTTGMNNLIDIFGKVVNDSNKNFSIKQITDYIKHALKLGYIVHPNAVCSNLITYLNSHKVNYNSTFYKNFAEVKSKNRVELLIDQLNHYMSTYGTNFTENAYVINSDPKLIEFDPSKFTAYKVITACSKKEMFDLCNNLICSDIALSLPVIETVCSYMAENADSQNDMIIRFDEIKNKEAFVMLCNMTKMIPNDKFALVRYMVYLCTGNTLVIQNNVTIKTIKLYNENVNWVFEKLTEQQMIDLSSIFYRYKKIFLAFKNSKTASMINKLRRYAKKYHEPMHDSISNTIFSVQHLHFDIMKFSEGIPIFKLVSLINTANWLLSIPTYEFFNIRNGSVWYGKFDRKMLDFEYIKNVKRIMYDVLIHRLSKNKCVVKFNDEIELACPTSEKKFIGDMPFGSNVHVTNHNYIGIYWKNEWGAEDFDLSFIDLKHNKIGWNANYYNNDADIVYSGDMTSANPEATEVMYMNKSHLIPGIIYVNRYFGDEGSKYQFIFGNSKNAFRGEDFDPNTIKFRTDCISSKSAQILGITDSEKFYFGNFGTGNSIVSRVEGTNEKYEAIIGKFRNQLMLRNVLIDAGFQIFSKDVEYEKGTKIIDFNTCSKSDIIQLFNA